MADEKIILPLTGEINCKGRYGRLLRIAVTNTAVTDLAHRAAQRDANRSLTDHIVDGRPIQNSCIHLKISFGRCLFSQRWYNLTAT